jgi:hypothetical protein
MGMPTTQTNNNGYYQQSVPPMGNYVVQENPPREYPAQAQQESYNTYRPNPAAVGYDQNPNQYRENTQVPQIDQSHVAPVNQRVPEDQGSNELLQYLDGFNNQRQQQQEPTQEMNAHQHQSSRRPPPGMRNRPNRPPPGFQKGDPARARRNVQLSVSEKRFTCGEVVLAKSSDGKSYPAKIAKILPDAYVIDWLDINESAKVSRYDVMAMPQEKKSVPQRPVA